jgi:CheY-like chemotaxis protein
MIAEASPFVRGLVRSSLEMAGYQVVEAADTQAALRELERRKIDVVLAGLDLLPDGDHSLLEEMRRLPGLAHVPALALSDSAEQVPGVPGASAGVLRLPNEVRSGRHAVVSGQTGWRGRNAGGAGARRGERLKP